MPILMQGPKGGPFDNKQVLPPSLIAVRLELRRRSVLLGSASGFIDIAPDGPVLVTNRHVFTGRDQFTGDVLDKKYAQVPDEVVIWFRKRATLELAPSFEPLFDERLFPLWREHPELRDRADIAVLPISPSEDKQFFPRLGWVEDMTDPPRLCPTDPVAVVGFPFGKHISGFPVWTTGSIASEPDFSYDDLPVFLIDARTRKAQSGSPVFFHSVSGFVRSSSGETCLRDGGPHALFLGLYSGRINADSDIGMVWRADAVLRAIQAGVPSLAKDPDNVRED